MARKRKADEDPVRTLDSWMASRYQSNDQSDEDNVVVAPPRKRQALRDLRVRQVQNVGPTPESIAWVQLPFHDTKFIEQFDVIDQLEDVPHASLPSTIKVSHRESKLPAPVSQPVARRPSRRQSSTRDYSAQIFNLEDSEDDDLLPDGRQEQQSEQLDSGSEFGGEASTPAEESDPSEDHHLDDSSSGNSDDVSESENDEKPVGRARARPKPTRSAKPNPFTGRATSKNMTNLLNPKKGEARGLDTTLPPLVEIGDIFQDLVQRAIAEGLDKVVEHIKTRKLRVATMCSGTESPLLAMQMIRDSLKATGDYNVDFEHLFSAEIVPFKQAYIERNFKPPIIFRDIVELNQAIDLDPDNPVATTAYGGKVAVPKYVHILIAGTSCVDFSRLNVFQKGMGDGGESDKTWHAVLAYCRAFRPAIVILENVRNAQWDVMLEHYQAIGYETAGVLVDTKHYYLPQTRQRGYMVCFDKEKMTKAGLCNPQLKWTSLMEKFKRPASAPVTSFLIPSDQIRIRPQMLEDDQATREVDWTQCEITQMEYRQDKRLGNARPYTHWQESGSIMPPDHAIARWFFDQVERVLDTIDAAHLRKALPKYGMFDSRYKTRIWNLSQNIYRDEDNQPLGLVGCITPTGMFFISTTGRTLTAEELLRLQGLPLDRISFTTETPSEMQDLAGNAMSSTVVGSAILSALIAGYKIIDAPQDTESVTEHQPVPHITLDKPAQTVSVTLDSQDVRLNELLTKARSSLRRCHCEGSTSIAEKAIQRCIDCGHTTCIACGGNPVHQYKIHPADNESRSVPTLFEDYLRSALPLALQFEAASIDIPQMNKQYMQAVEEAARDTFTFHGVRRNHCWTVTYRAPSARLELVIFQTGIQWRLYALPEKRLAANSTLRAMLQQPVATAEITGSLLDVDWHWRLPDKTIVPMSIAGAGAKVASWWCRNQMPDFRHHSVPEFLRFSIDDTDHKHLAQTINGKYRHLPQCGKACDSLYKKVHGDIYLFLDTTHTGPPENDAFVFSAVRDDLEPDEIRPILARIDPSWRPWSHDADVADADLLIEDSWIPAALLLRTLLFDSEITIPSSLDIRVPCSELFALARYELPATIGPQLNQIQQAHDDVFFRDHAWVFEIIRRNLPVALRNWQSLHLVNDHCTTCAPRRPVLRWRLGDKGNVQPYEDQETATRYEREIKSRPDLLLAEVSGSSLTLGLNIASLAHRAVARLQHALLGGQADIRCSWRFLTKSQANKYRFKPFKLQITSVAMPHRADVGMSVKLFPKQRSALAWMKNQEAGVAFRLAETEEARIPSLGWRAEVLAETNVLIRGGICADHPGFGKTITSLALIHSEFSDHHGKHEPILSKIKSQSAKTRDLIPVAATLIVSPLTLIDQWLDEIKDKLGSLTGVVAIRTTAVLSKYKIEDFRKAQIILVSRAVFGSETYADKLAAFAAVPPPATTSGRSYAQWLKFATKQIPPHLRLLKNEGTSRLKTHIKQTYTDNLQSDNFKAVVPSKRLRGSAYVAAQTSSHKIKKSNAPSTVDTSNIDMPLFEMFYFNRLVVDEFHQYEQKEYVSITALNAYSRWGLSATPALGDFYDVSQIARLLGVPLPIGSDQRGIMKIKNVRELRKDMTDFEHFDAMRIPSTNAMHERIHEIDQRFLDTFVRQNIMDFDELKYEDHLVPVALHLAHRAVYTELSQHLNSSNMRIKKSTKSKTSERQVLINDAIATSTTAEEALSKAAAYSDNANIQSFIARRQQELKKLLTKDIPDAIAAACSKETASYDKLKSRHESDILGDAETTQDLLKLFKQIITPARKSKAQPKIKVSSGSDDETGGDGKAKGTRALTAALNVKCNRLVVARRSLRYLENVLQLEQARQALAEKRRLALCDNPRCELQRIEPYDGAVSSSCGHTICVRCHASLKARGSKQCLARGCTAAMYDHHLLWLNKIGPSTTTQYGAKIETTVQLLQDIAKRGDQAILFVQFATQIDEVESALSETELTFTIVKSVSDSGKQIQDFRETAGTSKHKTVIVLNASDETAAGSNLQNANHVIFLSPLLRDTKYGYESTMAQAIGRVRRHGQKKEIHVYRLVALDTIDVDILEHRERRSAALVERGSTPISAPVSMAGKLAKGEKERTQLVKEHGEFSLRPRSWLVGSGEHELEKVKGKSRVLGWEDFSSLVKFSRAFTEDDD